MPTLTIHRVSQWANRFRGINLYANGEKLGVIADGNTLNFELTEGTHTIQARIDWCSSPEVEVELKKGKVQTLQLSGLKTNRWGNILAAVLLAGVFFVPEIEAHTPLVIGVIAILASPMLYYLTLGRKKYLKLKKDL